jgi:hypothetical protein
MLETQPALASEADVLSRLRRTAPAPGMVLPDYSGYSTCNVSQLIWRNFGLANRCPDCLAPLLDSRYRRVILLIVDALGWNQLQSFRDHVPPLQRVYERGRVIPLTVTFPSTTTVALTAIYTGLTPAEHSVTGHTMFVKEVGAVMDVLRFSPAGDPRREVFAERGVDVHRIFPMYTVFECLKKAGLDGLSITRGIFTNTALGWLHHVGAEVIGYLSGADMFVHLRNALRTRPMEGVICIYWDIVDMLSHEFGPFSEMVRSAVDQVFYALEREILERLSPAERAETLLLITADHGQADMIPDEALYLSEQDRLRELLMLPPTGQYRASYLYAEQGKTEELGHELERFSDRFWFRRSEEALAAGLFGPPDQASRIRGRVGDYVAIGRSGAQVFAADVMRGKPMLKGHHGSLTENEMLVPLIALPLDSW